MTDLDDLDQASRSTSLPMAVGGAVRYMVSITLRGLRRLLAMLVFSVASTALAIALLWALFITFREVIALLVLL